MTGQPRIIAAVTIAQVLLAQTTFVAACAATPTTAQTETKAVSSTSKAKEKRTGNSGHRNLTCDQVNSGYNIFSDPPRDAACAGDSSTDGGDSVSPGFRQPTDPKGKIRRLITLENNRFPTYQQVKQTPGLTGKQRKEIEKLYNASKEVVEPWIKELRDVRQKPQSAEGGPMFDERNPAQELLDRIRANRLETWNQVKLILTEQQVDQLERMRRGEMFTGLNTAITPSGVRQTGKFTAPAVMAPPPGTTIAPVDAN